jgi:hypothetical protein
LNRLQARSLRTPNQCNPAGRRPTLSRQSAIPATNCSKALLHSAQNFEGCIKIPPTAPAL